TVTPNVGCKSFVRRDPCRKHSELRGDCALNKAAEGSKVPSFRLEPLAQCDRFGDMRAPSSVSRPKHNMCSARRPWCELPASGRSEYVFRARAWVYVPSWKQGRYSKAL